MVRIIPFGELQETWPVIWGGAIFLLFIVCSADLDIHCDRSFSHHVKFYRFMIPPGWFVSVNVHLWMVLRWKVGTSNRRTANVYLKNERWGEHRTTIGAGEGRGEEQGAIRPPKLLLWVVLSSSQITIAKWSTIASSRSSAICRWPKRLFCVVLTSASMEKILSRYYSKETSLAVVLQCALTILQNDIVDFLSTLSLIPIKIKRFLQIYTHQIYLGAVQSPVDDPDAFCWPDHCALLRVLVADYSYLPGFSSLVPPGLASRHAGAFALRSLSLRWAGSRTAVWDFLPRF